jgi:hypothetical protein
MSATNSDIFFTEKVAFMGFLENAVAATTIAVAEPLVKRMCDIVRFPPHTLGAGTKRPRATFSIPRRAPLAQPPFRASPPSQVNKYQEQPHLLDAHMEGIVHPIMARARAELRAWHDRVGAAEEASSSSSSSSTAAPGASPFATQVYSNPVLDCLLTLVYALCKTRGYKHIVKLFPHEVADVEPCVWALLCQDTESHEAWETRYVLLLWLSILVLIPFDLSTVDSTVGFGAGAGAGGGAGGGGGIIARITSLCKGYLSDPGAVREAAAVCLARLLTRPDMDRAHLRTYVAWAADTLAACTAKEDGGGVGGGAAGGEEGESGAGGAAGPAGGAEEADAAAAAAGSSSVSDDGGEAGAADAGASGASAGGEAGGKAAPATATSIASRIFLATGVLTSLVNVAKFGHRDTLMEVLGDAFSRVSAIAAADVGGGRGAAAHRNVGLKASPLLRKLTVKLAARTGLTHLPPRVVAWRYNRGSRSLLENLSQAGVAAAKDAAAKERSGAAAAAGIDASAAAVASATSTLLQSGNAGLRDATLAAAGGAPSSASSSSSSSAHADAAHASIGDVPPELEDIIDLLLQGLRDSDTVVRWSAAKGIGRVTGRLPRDFGDDVVQAVLRLLTAQEGDGAWHGGCLALAELARRGLLLPARLPEVVPLVLQALQYDVRRGSHSVGQHVRDAACYVCWAFARAYAPAIMRPHVLPLASGMLITALFDREVNCRRAASAAFQENVGRQGHENFPSGIEILTAADYFTLGNRANAFLSVAPQVGAYPQYRPALLEHLLDTKLKHWDKEVRELAARALASMTPLDPGWMINVALPRLLPLTTSSDLYVRHGALLGIAELVLALAQVPPASGRIPQLLLDDIRNTVIKAEKARVYTGRGGEIVRAAMCRLLECQCLAGHALSRKAALRFLQTVDDCLKHPNDVIQAAAVAALRALTAHALADPEAAVLDKVTRAYTARIADENPAVRRGAALALGALPRRLLVGADLDKVVAALCRATQPEKLAYKRDAETRRNAAIALGDLVARVGFGKVEVTTLAALLGETAPAGAAAAAAAPAPAPSSAAAAAPPPSSSPPPPAPGTSAPAAAGDGLSGEQMKKVWSALLDATRDYATDNRGDVGSWVRKAALESLERVFVVLQASAWRYTAVQAALGTLRTASAPAAARVAAAEEVHLLLASSDPTCAAGGGASRLESLQHASGYGNITGYGAGIRLLPGGDPIHARVDAPVSAGGVPVGKGVATPYGVGVLRAVHSAGSVCEVAFPPQTLGAAYFPYGSALIGSPRVKAAAAPVSLAAESSSSAAETAPSSVALLLPRLAPGGSSAALVAVPAEDVSGFITPDMTTAGICVLLRQASEKLDLLRAVAGDALCRLIHLPRPLPPIPGLLHRERLAEVFPEPNWRGSAGGKDDFGEEDEGAGEERESVAAGGADAAAPGADGAAAAEAPAAPKTGAGAGAGTVQWAIPHQCFPRLVQILGVPSYTAALLEGMATAVGGLSESVVKHSTVALSAWADETKKAGDGAAPNAALVLVAEAIMILLVPRPRLAWELEGGPATAGSSSSSSSAADGFDPSLSRWFKDILGTSSGTPAGGRLAVVGDAALAAVATGPAVVNATTKVEVRLIVPALRTAEVLLSRGAFDTLVPPASTFPSELLALTRRRVTMARDDVARVMAAGAVYLGLLPFADKVRVNAVVALLDLLGHPFPRVRKSIAEKLYIRLLTIEDIVRPGEWGRPGSLASHSSGGWGLLPCSFPPSPHPRRLSHHLPPTSLPFLREPRGRHGRPDRDPVGRAAGGLPRAPRQPVPPPRRRDAREADGPQRGRQGHGQRRREGWAGRGGRRGRGRRRAGRVHELRGPGPGLWVLRRLRSVGGRHFANKNGPTLTFLPA